VHERARLAERLLASLDEDVAVADAWAAEIERRGRDHRAGTLPTFPADEVLADARKRLEQR